MIGKIIKVTKELLNSPQGDDLRGYSYNLPLFSTELSYAYRQELSEYVLQFGQIHNGYRYPIGIPFINDEDYKKVNAYGNGVIEENLNQFEFLL